MKKRVASILLALAVCLTLLPTAAWAAEENETTISSVAELLQFAQDVNAGKYDKKTDAVVSLEADLDLTGVDWTPIGSIGEVSIPNHFFSGKFYGNGHTISNLDFYSAYQNFFHVGFFGYIKSAEISGLTVQGSLNVIKGRYNYFGAIAGYAVGSKISNCAADVSFNNNGQLVYRFFGMFGWLEDSTVEYCQNKGSYLITGDMGSLYLGGIAGYAKNSEITYCSNTGDMEVNAPTIGGIAGQLGDNAKIVNCYFAGNLTPIGEKPNFDVGGIAGTVSSSAEISHCYFSGDLNLSQYKNATPPYGRLGGIVGKASDGSTFNNNYFTETANVTAGGNAGHNADAAGTAKSSDCMRTEEFYHEIHDNGGDYQHNPGGTPVLPQPKYTVSFVVTPAALTNVAIAVDGQAVSDNKMDLTAGTHTVTITADSCEPQAKEISITADRATHTQTFEMNYLSADYTAVDAALAKAEALNPEDYKDFSAVTAAIDAVDRSKNITQQAEVDAMAQAIETAIAGLEKKPTSSGGGSSAPSYGVSAPASVSNGTVTTRPKNAYRGDTVTVTAKPDAGYVLDSLTVTDAKGRALTLTDKGNGKYTFTMPGSAVSISARFVPETVTPEPESVSFRDVPDDAYYASAVRWAAQNSITGGVADGLFGPDQPCTRAQIITFLWRAAGSPAPQGIAGLPGDVDSSAYYAQAVLWALEKGIASGTGPDAFSPDAPCTRAQSVTFLFRAVGSPASSAASGFRDVADADYFAPAVTWAQRSSVTSGVGSGQFAPHQPCTRAQIITFLFAVYGQK